MIGMEGYTSDDDATYIQRKWQELTTNRDVIDAERYNNLAAITSHQWSSWNSSARKYVNHLAVSLKENRVRLTVNKIKSVMAARWSFIMGETPAISVDSSSPETKDKNAAYIAQRAIRADWEENKIWDRIKRTVDWVKPCGIGFTQTYYDPYCGKVIGYNGRKPVFEGKIKQKVLSPFSVAYDPLADVWEECKYVIVGSVIPREDAEARGWGSAIDEINESDTNYQLAPTQIHELYLELNNPDITLHHPLTDQRGKPRNILMLEWFERPCVKHPMGRYLVVVGKKVVRQDILEVNEVPITPFYDTTQPGVINCDSPVSDIRPLQEEFNRVESLALERMQMPDMYIFQKGTKPKSLTGKAVVISEYLPFAGGQRPDFVPGGIPRQDYMIFLEHYEKQIEGIAGVSALSSRAKTTSGMSGRLGYIVQEANRQLLIDVSDRFKQSVSDLVRLRLNFMRKYYTEERQMSYINEYDKREMARFTGADIGNNWAVSIRLKNSVSNADEQQAQKLILLAQNPAVTEQIVKNPQVFRKWVQGISMELGHELFVCETDVDVAQDENYEISQGGQPQVEPWHDDDKHNDEHRRQLNSDTTKQWKPQSIEYLKWHYQKHEEQKMAKFNMEMMKQMQMALAMQTGMGQLGGAKPKGAVAGKKQTPPGTVEGDVDVPLEQKTETQYPTGGTQ